MLEPLSLAARRRRGVTMLELAIGLAVLAVLAALSLPGFGGRLERQRTQGAAEGLAADLAEARFEAARRGLPLFVTATPGPDWCWSVATAADCPCGQKLPCQLRSSGAPDHRGVLMSSGLSVRLDPGGNAVQAQAATLETKRGERLRVEVSPTGRPRVCAVSGSWGRLPAC